jgi:hypothetical protein
MSQALKPEDALGHLTLVTEGGQRGPGDPGGVPIAGLSIGRPLFYPVHPDELTPVLRRRSQALGMRYLGMLCPATLDQLPRGRAFTAVSLTVRLEDTCRAVGLEADSQLVRLFAGPDETTVLPAPAGLRSAVRANPEQYSALGDPYPVQAPDGRPARPADSRVHGLFMSEFSWSYDASGAGRLAGRSLLTHAVLEIPAHLHEVSGRISAHVGMQRALAGFVRTQSAVSRESLIFREPVQPHLRSRNGRAVRLFVVADVERYSSRLISDAERVQKRLVEAMDRAQIATTYDVEDRQVGGDSVLYVFPPGIDEGRAIRRFYVELATTLEEINAELGAESKLRLRVGMDRGQSDRAEAGWSGQAVIAAGRLLNSQAARKALTDATNSSLALIVSDSLYQDVIREQAGPPPAESFVPVQATEAGKNFKAEAWVHVAEK